MFFGNTDGVRIIFRKRLGELQAHYPGRLDVHHILTKGVDEDHLFNGRITREKARELLSRFVSGAMHKEYFICGPEQMMVNVTEALETSGVPKKQIHVELFSTPVSAEGRKETAHATAPSATGTSQVKVVLDGREYELVMDPQRRCRTGCRHQTPDWMCPTPAKALCAAHARPAWWRDRWRWP